MDIPQLVQQLKAGDDTAGPVLVSIIAPAAARLRRGNRGDLSLAAVKRRSNSPLRRPSKRSINTIHREERSRVGRGPSFGAP